MNPPTTNRIIIIIIIIIIIVAIVTGQTQLARVVGANPTVSNYDWIRMPLSHEPDSLTVDDILPYLWELERRMALGNSVYLYSKDIHGRAAVMAGCLLGPLHA